MSELVNIGRHVLILTAQGSFTVAGRSLTESVDTADKLGKLILWAAHKRGGLQPIPGAGDEPEAARVWVTGGAVALLTGRSGATEEPSGLGAALAPLIDQGWELRGIGDQTVIAAHGTGRDRVVVEILAEVQPWLAGGDSTIADDAAELGRRLVRWYDAFGVLPGVDGAASGAAVADLIMDKRSGRRGAVVSNAGTLPAWAMPETRVQPAWSATADQIERELKRCDELHCLTQLHPALASAGMLTFGYGQPRELDTEAAVSAAGSAKRPFGLWLTELPAGNDLAVSANLPLPHPQMAADHRVQAWLSTEDLDGLTKDVRDGGAGLSIDQLAISEAIVWPQKVRLLEAWATRMREARELFADDAPMLALVDVAATAYLAALADPDRWDQDGLEHHFQPAWAAAIAAHIRMRARRAAMRISREHRAWPIYIDGTSMVFGPARRENEDDGDGEEQAAPIDLSDTHTRLGRHITTARAELADETIVALLLAETPADTAAALRHALGAAVPTAATAPPPAARQEVATAPVAGADEPSEADETSEATAETGPRDEPEQQGPAATDAGTGPKKRRGTKSTTPVGGTPAAVLDIDGLWLADGTHIELDQPITHVGQVAELAYAHDLGYQLTENFAEPGQIWLSFEACEQFGIDVDAIDHREASKSLRELTKDLPFVELAVEQGWRFGGVSEDEQPGLGAWTRVYREGDEKKGVWIVLTAGLPGDEKSMPIFGGDPSPVQVARRLKLLADALRFPWKINANSTSIDIMVQSRPKTWSPKDWKNVVLAPSTTEVPYNIIDVETIFNWSREPLSDERGMEFLHGYDRGGSYVAGIAGVELPIGSPTHHPDGAEFDARVPAYHLIVVPEQKDAMQPYVLNPKAHQFTEPKWVCSPRIDQAIRMGYEVQILESYTWDQHGRVLLGWYERFRDASMSLDTDDPDEQAARDQSKVVRTSGIGILGSDLHYKGKMGYNPERRLHIISKADANITYRINDIGEKTGRWPLAVLRDTVFYASNEADPDKAWPGAAANYGRGFGQYKPERSGLLADQLKYLNGHGYQGKTELIPVKQWRLEHGLTTNGGEAQ